VIDITETGAVSVIRMDDGKANALSFDMMTGIIEALEKQAERSGAVVLAGRPGLFCAGLDLKVVKSGDREQFAKLLEAGRDLYRAMLNLPAPLVAACTGHAMAGGALMLLCSDYRVGVAGDYRIGFHEVSIGVPMPTFGTRMAQLRLNRARYLRAVVLAEVTGPAEAVEVGFLDEVVDTADSVLAAAVDKAKSLAQLPREALVAGRRTAYTVARDLEGF
jgi:enoyl-CoA hydratase